MAARWAAWVVALGLCRVAWCEEETTIPLWGGTPSTTPAADEEAVCTFKQDEYLDLSSYFWRRRQQDEKDHYGSTIA